MNILNRRSRFLWVLAAFYISLLTALILVGVLVYHNSQQFNKGADWVTHSRSVLERTDSIQILSQELQWQSRNYILTRNANAYQTYLTVRDSLRANAAYFIQLVADNKSQQTNAIKLQQLIIQLIQFTDGSLQLRQTLTNTVSNLMANMQQHSVLHNTINQQIEFIRSEENHLLSIRRNDVFETVNLTNRLFIASGILILITLTGTFLFVFYHFKKRQRAEKKLMESEQRFSTLINSTKDLAIYTTDENGCILDWYKGAHNLKGYNKEDVIGKNVSIFYTPEAIANGEPQQNLQAAAQEGSLETEGWRVRKGGSRFWADVLITAIYDEDGKLQGFTKVTRDFSLHKQAEDDIKNALEKEKELNAMKSNFVSMASHEFRTPLSTVLSSVSLLEHYTTTETQNKRDKHIQRIKSSVGEMVAILEEFLSLEKIEEGKVHVKKELFNLKDLSEQLQNKFNPVLKNGQVINYNHNGKEEVLLDASFINHILNNLLSNAVKYSPENTQVIFETSVEENTITLKVKDHGIGISTEDQKHLFERFFRASNTGGIKGTGLGLHIIKRYIDLMRGSIYLESEIGNGTTFTVTLPQI
jgi:PAS domain S-box-containing protein